MSIFYPLLAALPIGFLAVIVAIWRKFENTKGLKQPINDHEKFLRTPGYSAFNELQRLNEKVDDLLTWFTILPASLAICYLGLKISGNPLVPHLSEIFFAGFATSFIYFTFRVISVIKTRQNWLLGFRGERAVGEYLNQLMRDGCHVFHDFPLNGNGNLDHIVVAPSGVYAIETKTKRKHSRRENNHEVTYDGRKLEFPGWTETAFLTQAHNQANQLARILAAQLKKPIKVEPVLTLPGWYIKRRGKGDVHVLNHKEIASLIVENESVLSPDDIVKIAVQLDTRCRDVAF